MNYILMAVILIPFLSFCAITVNNFIVDKKQNRKISLKSIYTLSALIAIVITFISYIANMGYIRLTMALPIYLHTLAFFFVTYGSSALAEKSKWLNISIIASLISFLAANVLLPDNALYGYDYALFGYVTDQNITYILNVAARIFYTVNAIALAAQLVLFAIAKKRSK